MRRATLVELFDFINGVEDSGSVHCFDVIDAALGYARHAFNVALSAFLRRHCYSFNRCDGERCIIAFGDLVRRLNLSRPTFSLCVCEYRTLREAQVSGDFTQSDAGCVGCADFSPGRFWDRSPQKKRYSKTQRL